MAENLGSAVLELSADDAQLKKDLDSAERSSTKFMGGLKTVAIGVGAAGVTAAAAVGAAAFDISKQVEEATASIEAQLGVTEEEAGRLADVARDVFGNNFAGSVGEAADAVAALAQHVEGVAGMEQNFTELAFNISDAFDQPVEDVIKAVGTLQEEFDGLSTEQAFDLITTGFQRGLDKSGDFIESIGEYSNQFSDAGFTAEQFFSTMEEGQKGGILGTDKIADAFKEFQLRILGGGDAVAGAFETMGLSLTGLWGEMEEGKTMAEVFDQLAPKIAAIENPAKRARVEMALFGTQAEDVGFGVVTSIDTAATSLDDMAGATQDLNSQYDTLGNQLSGIWRSVLVQLSPLTDELVKWQPNISL